MVRLYLIHNTYYQMETDNFESPKQALIRLLRSQGCCQCEDTGSSSELQQLLQYRKELQSKLNEERNKLGEIPCAITLAQEIEEVRDVVAGLGRENRGRLDILGRVEVQAREKTSMSGAEAEEAREHQRLQHQYANLLRQLESTNDTNRRLVERLSRYG